MTNNLLLFGQELFNRFIAPTPKYFKVWQLVFTVLTVLTGLPSALTALHVHLPEFWEHLASKTVAAASMGALVMAQMAVKPKVADTSQLPFTRKHTG
jgi:hypothetical protein